MSSTKNAIILVFLTIVIVSAVTGLLIRGKALEAEASRKLDADGYAISRALKAYKLTHDGALPSSLHELEFDRNDVDVSPFRMFAPGTRRGELGKDVFAEAGPGGNGTTRIVIYADGAVRYE